MLILFVNLYFDVVESFLIGMVGGIGIAVLRVNHIVADCGQVIGDLLTPVN